MTRALVLAVLLTAQSSTGAPAPEPSTSDLAASVTVYDPSGPVTIYDPASSVTVLKTEVKVGAQTVVTISADVLFDFGSAALTTEATARVKEVATQMTHTTKPVTVVGHTDSIGDDAFNVSLSTQRAKAVGAVLQAALPAGTQIATEGHGAREPIASNSQGGKDDPGGRAKNRRVTITYTP